MSIWTKALIALSLANVVLAVVAHHWIAALTSALLGYYIWRTDTLERENERLGRRWPGGRP